MRLAQSSQLRSIGSRLQATRSAIEIHTIVRPGTVGAVVEHHRPVVHVVNVAGIHVSHRAVVEEVVPTPVTAVVPRSDITETIVNSAVEAHVRSPVATMEQVVSAVKTPPGRRP